MKNRYLEVTYRKGIPIAAYLYLPRKGDEKAARTDEYAPGILVDFSSSGSVIGIEISSPGTITPSMINEVLIKLGLDSENPADLAPLKAA